MGFLNEEIDISSLHPFSPSFFLYRPAHFSENWGYMCIVTIAGSLFSITFGWNLDAHDSSMLPAHDTLNALNVTAAASSTPRCHIGKLCYVDMFYVASGACLLCMGLSVWAAWRERERLSVGMDDVGGKRGWDEGAWGWRWENVNWKDSVMLSRFC